MPGESLQTKMEAYFQSLAQHAPQTTVNSHKSSIPPFVSFCQRRRISIDALDIAHVQAFLTPQLTSHSIQTVKGYIDSLANFLAYVWKRDPAIVKAHIYHSSGGSSAGDEAWTNIPASASACLETTDRQFALVEMLIEYLRLRRYGSRKHAFVELLTATASRPSVIRHVNLGDLDQEDSTVLVSIPQTHAVSACGLLQDRSASLPSRTVDALQAYLDHEYVATEDHNHKPLFTTASGRVAPSTIRRSIKQASKESLTTPIVQHDTDDRIANEPRDDEPAQTVTPSDIWRYSLTQCIDH